MFQTMKIYNFYCQLLNPEIIIFPVPFQLLCHLVLPHIQYALSTTMMFGMLHSKCCSINFFAWYSGDFFQHMIIPILLDVKFILLKLPMYIFFFNLVLFYHLPGQFCYNCLLYYQWSLPLREMDDSKTWKIDK